MTIYLTKTNKILTEADIEKLAEEAEVGYVPARSASGSLLPRERAKLDPPMADRPTVSVILNRIYARHRPVPSKDSTAMDVCHECNVSFPCGTIQDFYVRP